MKEFFDLLIICDYEKTVSKVDTKTKFRKTSHID